MERSLYNINFIVNGLGMDSSPSIAILLRCNFLLKINVPHNINICHIISLLGTYAIKLTELDGGFNRAHFGNFRRLVVLISNVKGQMCSMNKL